MRARNIIHITCDELRADAVGFMGNPDCKTPNLDAFAADAVVFPKHHTVHGKCVPSRVAMVTGRYSHTDGFRTITETLQPDQPNLHQLLKDNGYETAIFGHNHKYKALWDSHEPKNGFADYHSFTDGPLHDMSKVSRPAGGPAQRASADDSLPNMRKPWCIEDEIGSFSDDNRADQAIYYLRELRDSSKPFFLTVDFGAPHPPYNAPEPYYSMYDPNTITPWPYELPENAPLHLKAMREHRSGEPSIESLREIQAVYYAKTSKVETLVGQVIDELKALDLYEESIIIFTSDHGDFAGQYGLPEKWDTCMNDCILRVPFLLRAPGLPTGVIVDSLSEHVDIVPTILDLIDLEADWGIHGSSLLPLVSGDERRDAVYADGGHEEEMWGRLNHEGSDGKQLTYRHVPESMSRTKMVCTEDWKLVVRLTGGNELYNMREDPRELNNIYEKSETDPELKSIVADLQLKLIEWCLRTDTDRPYQAKVGA